MNVRTTYPQLPIQRHCLVTGIYGGTSTAVFFLFWAQQPHSGPWAPSFTMFLDHTQRRTAVGRTPLDEWSARRRDLYLTTHDTHNRHTSITPRWDSNPRSQKASGRRAASTAVVNRNSVDRLAPDHGAVYWGDSFVSRDSHNEHLLFLQQPSAAGLSRGDAVFMCGSKRRPCFMPFCFNTYCQSTSLLNLHSLIFGLTAGCLLLLYPLVYDENIIFISIVSNHVRFFQEKN
jgi:hypothetical protein